MSRKLVRITVIVLSVWELQVSYVPSSIFRDLKWSKILFYLAVSFPVAADLVHFLCEFLLAKVFESHYK